MLKVLAVLLISIPISLLRGYVLTDLVEWFTPYHISVIQGVGLLLIATMLTYTARRPEAEPDTVPAIVSAVVLTLTIWGFGAIWSMFL